MANKKGFLQRLREQQNFNAIRNQANQAQQRVSDYAGNLWGGVQRWRRNTKRSIVGEPPMIKAETSPQRSGPIGRVRDPISEAYVKGLHENYAPRDISWAPPSQRGPSAGGGTVQPTATPTVAELEENQRNIVQRVLGKQTTPTPTPISTAMPTSTPTPQATPTPIPSSARNVPYEERPYADLINKYWEDQLQTAHDILRWRNQEGVLKGENVAYKTGKRMDIPNRIDPETGEYSSTAPITTYTNPITGRTEKSIDRGLYRINNRRFMDFLASKKRREMMYNRGIIPRYHEEWEGLTPEKVQEYWNYMLEPEKNIQFAKLLFDEAPHSWYGARPGSGAKLYK